MLTEADCKAMLLIEKATSYEALVKKFKKKNVATPYAAAWSEAMGAACASALLKGGKQESRRIRESGMAGQAIMAASAPARDPHEGPIVKVVLLTEGLGNLRDKNYYGPEAIHSMPAAFEGVQMMVDHPSYSEEKDIPEGRVGKTVAYYKNLRVETFAGKLACVGEAHFDLSQEGQNAYRKAMTAVHYGAEFPGTGKEYVGLSINSEGESEHRTMKIEGQSMDVNYVLRFVNARSCDMVTIPARGGKFVALMESIAGARLKKEETRMETLKRLEAAQAALKEAEGEKDADKRQQKLTEARTEVESLLNDIREAAKKKAEPDDDDETEEAKEAAKKAKAEKEKKDKEDEAEDKKESAESKEAHRLAVKSLISESGLNAKYFDQDELAGMTLKEAKREIARTKRIHESTAEEIIKKYGDVSAAHPIREAAAGGGDQKANFNHEFAKPEA